MVGGAKYFCVILVIILGFSRAVREGREERSEIDVGQKGASSLLQFVDFKSLGGAAVSFMPPQLRGAAGGALNLLEAEALRKQVGFRKAVMGLVNHLVLGRGSTYGWR
ncbi:hypothetical protein Pmar_PMAR001356 [Perkinsus marinus ATCC 50983]|uniref:Uncharacterized protein n=1 Tax=Perkinsus marinus (strain ATCC 50983 / TXsc) TaxID=423536 RepID=C5KJH3_PERM5|nr:hypothetical protein Pmar_PMAR001356 [Perkinsus marinus ATCC 50983]EER15307.1 hypothetical protein Pmar_PMAR001356 [Perkinsus marinus ATCC 50983]|eukprot:XP_002783511.1 hypothetical protein Pmar_PMAR001356 [Perkinsus marinus ATCC 50983]